MHQFPFQGKPRRLKVFVDSDQGWSSFSGYTPIRADHIEDGPSTGTAGEPIEIDAFPLSDLRWTAGAASDQIDRYACAPDTDESGPEMLYTFSVAEGGTLRLTVSDDSGGPGYAPGAKHSVPLGHSSQVASPFMKKPACSACMVQRRHVREC